MVLYVELVVFLYVVPDVRLVTLYVGLVMSTSLKAWLYTKYTLSTCISQPLNLLLFKVWHGATIQEDNLPGTQFSSPSPLFSVSTTAFIIPYRLVV